jgi:putative ABC transport system substrate-binding protein
MSRIQRRQFLIAAGASVAVRFARAQQRVTAQRIGYLGGVPGQPPTSAFQAGLRDLGWIDGQNLVIEWRTGTPRYPELAMELVALKPDLIVATLNVAAVPLKRLTTSIPIVVIASHAPIEMGLVTSLSRPGANITGTVSMAPDLDVKRMELLKAMIPKLSSMGFLYTELELAWRFHLARIEEACRSLGVAVRPYLARDIDAAFASMANPRPDALLVQTDNITFPQRQRIVELAQMNRIPVMFEFRQFVEAGGLMSYGPDLGQLWYRGAYFVDRILKGAHPADLPMEQPTRFEFVINMKTANALGIKVPPLVLLRADRLIE